MKLRPVTKIDKATKTQLKTIDDEIMSENWKPDPGRIVCKTYIFIKSNLLSYKN